MSKKRVTFTAGLKPLKSYSFTERTESDLYDAPVIDLTTGRNKTFCSVIGRTNNMNIIVLSSGKKE